MDKPPYLTLVDPGRERSHDEEFIPLPFYPFNERPASMPLDPDECATAIHIAKGDIPAAAALLKVPEFKLNRQIRHHPRLVRVRDEALEIVHNRAASEYIQALDSPSDRRREWAAAKILATRSAASHPFAPAPPQPNAQQASLSLSSGPTGRTITFRWRSDADDVINSTNEQTTDDAG
jgi:hypothetical protein